MRMQRAGVIRKTIIVVAGGKKFHGKWRRCIGDGMEGSQGEELSSLAAS